MLHEPHDQITCLEELRKSGKFRVTFISQIFDFRIISESLNAREYLCSLYKAYCNSLSARTLFSLSKEFGKIIEN